MLNILRRLLFLEQPEDSPQALASPFIGLLASTDQRAQSREAFISWAHELWGIFEANGPLVPPLKRFAYSRAGWFDSVGNVYAGLYPRDGFTDFLDFALFNRFSSSIHQIQYQGSEVDMSWFVPEDADEAIQNHIDFLQNIDHVSYRDEITATIRRWRLPSQFGWIHDLNPECGFTYEDRTSGDILAVTKEGFLHCFAQDDGFEETFPPLQ